MKLQDKEENNGIKNLGNELTILLRDLELPKSEEGIIL